ncbi:MAG: hypothetical protein ABI556_17335 [Gemmatimonadales bacterium]
MRRPHLVAAAVFTVLAVLPCERTLAQAKELTLTASPEAIAHFRQGWLASDLNNQSEALKHFKMASDADPSFGLARVMYRYSGAANDTKESTDDVNRAVVDAAKASTAELLLTLAFREAVVVGTRPAAILLRAASELIPTDPTIATLAFYSDPPADPKAQLTALKGFAARFPDYASIYNGLAYAAWAANDHPAGLDAARMQVKLLPDNPNSHDTYAELLQWDGNYAEALKHYGDAVKLDPAFVEGYRGMAEVEALQGHYDKARVYANQAISGASQPGLKLFYMRDIAGLFALAGDTKAMQAQLTVVANEAKAAGNNRIAAVMYGQLAASSANMGDGKAAHAYLDMARSMNYTDPDAQISYFTTMTHAMLKHWEPANAALAAAKAAPELGFKQRVMAAEAYLATAQGKPADAVALLASADQTDMVVAGRLAEAYAALGRTEDAAKMQQQILDSRTLVLADFGATNARARARKSIKVAQKK